MMFFKHTQTVKLLLLSLLFGFSVIGANLVLPANVLAADGPSSTTDIKPKEDDCKVDSDAGEKLNKDNCQIIKLIIVITNIISGIAGIVIVSMVIFGGIQYSMAGADPSKVQAARQKIINALTALLLLVFGYALLQWLVPGGIF